MTAALPGAFFEAVKRGHKDQVRAFLASDASLVEAFDPDEFGATPLNLAASRGDLDMVDLLLQHGADPDRRSDWWAGGFNAVASTFWGQSPWMAEALLERGATLDVHGAAGLGRTQDLRRLLDEDPSRVHEPGGDGQRPLHFAANPEVVRLLLERGADIDARDVDHGSTAAQWAINGRAEVTKALIERGAEVDPFMLAAIGDRERLGEWIDRQPEGAREASGTRCDESIFHAPLSEGGHIYRYVVGAGAALLHVAARYDRDAVVRLLIERGADPDVRGGYDDQTPLHAAAWHASLKAIDALLDGGADLECPSGDLHENTPVGWAIVAGRPAAVRRLMERGAEQRPWYMKNARSGLAGNFRGYTDATPADYEAILDLLAGSR